MTNKQLIITHEENTEGRDFVVGDIHNQVDKLLKEMSKVDFDFSKDRLFSVGDLFDRGTFPEETIDFFLEHNNKGFYPVIGNHELMLIDKHRCLGEFQEGVFEMNGGWWYHSCLEDVKEQIVSEVEQLPYIRLIKRNGKLYSVSHSEMAIDYENTSEEKLKSLTWSRRIWKFDILTPENITNCFVGHTIFKEVKTSGKYINLDTGSFVEDGKVTLWEIK